MRNTLARDIVSTPPENSAPTRSVVVNHMTSIHRTIARVLLGGIAVQFFFAGLGVFGVTSFLPHVIFGSLVVLASFALPIIAWRGRLAAGIQRRSWLLAGLMILQGLLIDAGHLIPLISAFHPVNAMLIALLTFSLI